MFSVQTRLEFESFDPFLDNYVMSYNGIPKYLFCGGLQCWGHKYIWSFVRRLVWKMISSFPIMQHYPRTHLYTLVMDITQLLTDHFVPSFSVHK